jgi:hypothetical protein
VTTEAIVTTIVAAWGAITGSVAVAVQLAQHRSDRAKIHLFGKMTISSTIDDPLDRYAYEFDVVNRGRRVAHIAEVYVNTSRKGKPGPKWLIFDAKGEMTVALNEGETKRFEGRIMTDAMDKLFESLETEELFSVRLTTGEIHIAKFFTVKKSMLTDLGRK